MIERVEVLATGLEGRYPEGLEGKLILNRSQDGDIYVSIGSPFGPTLRFCTVIGGGGRTTNTRRALVALMEAMVLDGGKYEGEPPARKSDEILAEEGANGDKPEVS